MSTRWARDEHFAIYKSTVSQFERSKPSKDLFRLDCLFDAWLSVGVQWLVVGWTLADTIDTFD